MDSTAASTLIDRLDRELWLVTAQSGERRSGLIATFVNSASIVPAAPRMIVGLAKQHRTCEIIESSNAFALHLLGAQHLDWVWRFGLASGRDGDKFVGLEVHRGETGSPLLAGAVGWLDCRVESRLDIGDRIVYLGAVVQGSVTQLGPPLTLKQMLQQAPVDKLHELKRRLHDDSLIDEEALRLWRETMSLTRQQG